MAQHMSNTESKEPEEEQHSSDSTDLVFPSFDCVSYLRLRDKFSIALPPFLRRWLTKLLSTIIASDIAREVHAFAWMVLLYPSLLLLQRQHSADAEDSDNLDALVRRTIAKMRDFMVSHITVDESMCQFLRDSMGRLKLLK